MNLQNKVNVSKVRKGFYFSFDALLALSVMAATLAVVSQSSYVSSDSFQVTSIDYKKASTTGQDAMKMASSQDFYVFNSSFRQDLVDDTVMENSDLNKTIIDGISLLWAARNFSEAEEVAERYFGSKVPDEYEYRLQVNEDGTNTVIYKTSTTPNDAEIVTSISRLVSGHKIDKPSEGFQARARATSVTKNSTKVVPIPPLGYANEGGSMEATKEFWLNDTTEILNGTFYISVHYDGDTHFQNFKINGNQYASSKINWLYDDGGSGSPGAAYGKLDVTSDLKEGKNTLEISTNANDYSAHFHPGTKLEIDYSADRDSIETNKVEHERIYLENILSENKGPRDSGAFVVEEFSIPEDAEFLNASFHLHTKKMNAVCGGQWYYDYSTEGWELSDWDVRVNFNGEVVHESCAEGSYQADISLSESDVEKGTNVLTTYVNNYGDAYWGGTDTQIFSSIGDNTSSHIDVWYKKDSSDLRFGEVEITTSENIGGSPEEPKTFEKEFNYTDVVSTEIYMAQSYSTTPSLEIDNGSGYQTVFSSSSPRSAPTRIYAGEKYYDVNEENTLRFDDTASDREFLPWSTFQWTLWVPSQVGYGDVFENRSAAVEDAEERLEDKMGKFVDATGIETGELSTGSQPYLWGPASVKLVIWRE